MEVGRNTGTPYSEKVGRLCDCGEVEDQFIKCHSLFQLDKSVVTLQSASVVTLSSSFIDLSDKCKFLICVSDRTSILLIL